MVIVPNLVSESELGAANSIVEAIWNGASLLGPLLGGFFISKFGASMAIFCDGISFWVAALCIFFIKETYIFKEVVASRDAPSQRFFKEAWDGFKMLLRLKAVWWITLCALFFTLAFGQLEVSLPLYTHNELSKSAFVLGTFWTTYFIFSLIGSIISGLISKGRKSGILMGMMTIGWGMSFIPMFWWHSLLITYVSMLLSGLLFGGYPPLSRTTVQRLVPKEFQGRIFGIRGSLIAIGPPIGSYLSGLLGQWMSPSSVIGFMGFLIMCIGLFLFSHRHFREI
jgi:MFS family permease